MTTVGVSGFQGTQVTRNTMFLLNSGCVFLVKSNITICNDCVNIDYGHYLPSGTTAFSCANEVVTRRSRGIRYPAGDILEEVISKRAHMNTV